MNNKLKAALIALLCVAVIGGAYLLYQTLAAENQPSALEGTPTPSPTPSQEAGEEQEGALAEATGEPEQAAEQEEAFMAPDFTAYDAAGEPVALSDYEGRPTVLLFWASWCGACKSEMPAFQAAHEAHGESINFVAVDLCGYGGDDEETAKSQIEEAGYTFDVLYDRDGEAVLAYSAYSIPVTCFISAEGELVQGYIGALNESIITEHALALLE